MVGDVFAQGTVDAGLVALTIRRMSFKPVDHISIKAQGKLLFYGAKKKAATCAAPILLLWYIAGIDLDIRQCGQSLKLGLLCRSHRARILLLHRLSFHARLLYGR